MKGRVYYLKVNDEPLYARIVINEALEEKLSQEHPEMYQKYLDDEMYQVLISWGALIRPLIEIREYEYRESES